MAAAPDPLESLFANQVDENEISALVGSLESQLASPPIKDSAGQNSSHSVLSNHVEGVGVSTPVSSHTVTAPGKAGLLQNNSEIRANASNGSNNHASHNQVLSANSISTNAVSQSSANTGVHVLSSVNSSPLTTRNVASPSPNSRATVNNISSTLVSQPNVGVPNQAFVTVGSTNTGTVVIGSAQNSRNTVTLNSTVPQGVTVLPNHNTVTNSVVQSTGSNVQGTTSAIHNLASVAAAQAPLTIPNTSLAPGPNGSAPRITVQQNDTRSTTPVNINTVNVPRTKLVMQSRPPEIRMVAQNQPQTVIPSSQQQTLNVSTVKIPNANPASSNVITLANKPANPQTVTVVRPNTTTQPQQVQIINRVPGTVAAQPKVLAPRTVNNTPIRIAPQQVARPQVNTVSTYCS